MDLQEVEERLNFWNFPHTGAWHLGTVGNFPIDLNPKTLIVTWLTMILVAAFAIAATRNMSMKRPNSLQTAFEMVYDFISGLVEEQITDPVKAMTFLGIPLTFFIFILFSNLLGLIPTLTSPTADLNTTVGFALCTFLLFEFMGIYYKGGKHFKHYLEPFVFFLPINIIEDLSKPITLSFRLYGNIFAGEVLLFVILGLMPPILNFCGGFIIPVVWLAYSIFVGCIQAYVFTILSTVYVSQKISDTH
jgi:F-type H+-transporting ATPase subunit a